MKRKRFTEEQIIGVLKQAEAGAKTADLCRQMVIANLLFNASMISGRMTVSLPLSNCVRIHS